ncbi:YveK family protein [Nosocomiicoccus ampullae]|uniref:YveK family protein n=1 Tax=Nosocomiicoccus ampullae TaxID=489910 RepID=UPI00254BEC98|nr:Wzz/FepE/Etk N-terminal domain-containing protein [Nosocomiicoccus ampullae]MDK6864073.1 Wzz/FepE/Etk N-terminal domain-containing protein [Nosocomiicoccus ampullae]
MEETLNLEDILEVIKKNILMIAIMMLWFGCIAAYATFSLMTPQYVAKTQILVSQAQNAEAINNQDIQASLQLINTYRDIIKSPTVLDEVVSNLELQESSSAISNKIEVTNQNQSQVLTVTVTDESAQRAEYIANEVATVFQNTVPEVMNVDNVSVLAAADVGENPSPVSPQPMINIAIGLILGLLTGLGFAFLRTFMDKRIQTEEDVEKHLDLPVLGTVPTFKK